MFWAFGDMQLWSQSSEILGLLVLSLLVTGLRNKLDCSGDSTCVPLKQTAAPK